MLRTTLSSIRQQAHLSRPYLIVTAVAFVLFLPTWLRLMGEWLKWEQVLAHGLPSALIYLGLLLIHPPKPVQGNPDTPKPRLSILGSFFLIANILAWALLELVRIDTLAYLMLPAGVLTTAWAMLGFRPALRLLPYVMLLGLSLPIWSDIVPYLVILATVVVSDLVRLIGMPALIEGANITLPYGRLVIADGCSGIRYFAISILLAMMTAILNDYRWKGWLAAVTIGMGVALLVNWVRITALVVIAHQTDMQSSLMTDHETFGWVIFAAFVIPVMLLAPVHRRKEVPPGEPARVAPKSLAVVIAGFVLGTLGITLAHSAAEQTPDWQLASTDLVEQRVERLPLPINLPDQLHHQAWQTRDLSAWVSLAQSQKLDREDKLVPYLPRPVDPNKWFVESRQGPVVVYQNLTNRRRVAFTQLYQIGSYQTDSYRNAKLLQIPATLTRQNRFALITLQAPCSVGSCEEAIDTLRHLRGDISIH